MKWPEGCSSGGAACGIKQAAPDVAVLLFDEPVAWAGAFTQNAAAAAPVRWSRARRGRPARTVVVNSGNANACTGRAGDEAVRAVVAAAAAGVGCSDEEVLVASTGPIGRLLPADRITRVLPALVESADAGVEDFATAILTTDTVTKTATASGAGFTVVGVAKGAAMVAPNMATMLAFIVTDARAEPRVLDEVLQSAVAR